MLHAEYTISQLWPFREDWQLLMAFDLALSSVWAADTTEFQLPFFFVSIVGSANATHWL